MKRAGTVFLFLLLILFPKSSVEGARQGLILWGLTLVPTLLPFFIVTRSILQWSVPGILLFPYLLFIGYFCGYPTGALVIDQLYNSRMLTGRQAELLVCFCNQSSPAFLFHFVYYHYFRAEYSAFALLFPIYSASVIWTILFIIIFRPHKILSQQEGIPSEEQSMEEIFLSSVAAIIKIGCFMLLFSIVIQTIFTLFSSRWTPVCIISCFLEITNGVHFLSSAPVSTQLKTALTGALCSFGGICSIAQVRSALSKELSLNYYLLFKLCTAFTAFILVYLTV